MSTTTNTVSSLVRILGTVLIVCGLWGAIFTYRSVAAEQIVTPSDARIPHTSVRGPWTLMAQADIIRSHTLTLTNGQTYAQMPRMVEHVDAQGEVVRKDDGEAVLIPNSERDLWIKALTLQTALHLAVVSYSVSFLAMFSGLGLILTTKR